MSDRPLVSVVTPCYNGEKFVDRYFACILAQSYPAIELIFVDDGSTDDTYNRAESWRAALEKRGIVFKLLTHPNGGQASAINLALPEVTGEYITWPDSDDLMMKDCLERKTSFLESNPEKGLVVCSSNVVHESDLNKITGISRFDPLCGPRIFDALIREEKGAYCAGIAYMARTALLFDALQGRHIYESPSGQNWQLLFPITYHYDCGFIDEVLATYVVRDASHSRQYASPQEQEKRVFELMDIIEHVLPEMAMTEEDFNAYWLYSILKYLDKLFMLAVASGDLLKTTQLKQSIESMHVQSKKYDLLCTLTSAGLGPRIYKMQRFSKRSIDKLKRTMQQLIRYGGAKYNGLRNHS